MDLSARITFLRTPSPPPKNNNNNKLLFNHPPPWWCYLWKDPYKCSSSFSHELLCFSYHNFVLFAALIPVQRFSTRICICVKKWLINGCTKPVESMWETKMADIPNICTRNLAQFWAAKWKHCKIEVKNWN